MEPLKLKRKIDSTSLQIDELRFWMGKEVDIIIKEKTSSTTESSKSSAAGLLSDYKNKGLIASEKNGWAKAVRDKHGNR